MAKRIDAFRDSISTYGQSTTPNGNWFTDALGNVTEWAKAAANPFAWDAVREFDSTTPQQRNQPEFLTQLGNDANRYSQQQAAVGALASPLLLLEAGQRGVNTALAGSGLAFGDYAPWNVALRKLSGNEVYNNPLARDGFQWSDIPNTYRAVWGNDKPMIGRNGLPVLDKDGNPVMEQDAVTTGQAGAAALGNAAVNAFDAILPMDLRARIDQFVEEDSARALRDPLNERGLLSWASGLHSESSIFNMAERESAFNQGAGRWITGTADAAVAWWLAPEVIGLKALGLAGRSLFLKSIDELSDIEKARTSIDLHRMFLNGEEGGRKTDFGRLLESFVRMDEAQMVRHQIAKQSTDSALVARTFGGAKTFDEAADRFLALSGDLQAIDRLFATDKVLGDAMRLNVERLADLRSQIDEITKVDFSPNNQAFIDRFVDRYQTEANRIEEVITAAKAENKSLESAIAGLNREAGLPDAVRFGQVQLSKLAFGPNSAARMEANAVKEANRATGRHLWKTETFKTGGTFGRNVRVWQSAYDYMRTNRIRGFARLTDSNDVIAELDASMMTLPMFRALQKQFQGEALLPGTDQLVSDFREEIIGKLVNARTPTERMNVWNDYEDRVWKALLANYNVSPESAASILAKYNGTRQVVTEVAKAKGFIVDQGEVNIIPELQALLAEGMPTMDFHFIETLFRLEQGSGISRGKDWLSIRGSRGLAAFDAIWRPLVLLRLGYTIRNVAEGGLRELAAFGTLGSMYQAGSGTRAIAGNAFARWGAGLGRGMDRAVSLRHGSLRRKRLNLDSAQVLAKANLRKVRELENTRTTLLGRATARADAAERRARTQLLQEARNAAKARVGVTWEQVTDEAFGEIDELMRQSSEIIVPVQYVRPFLNRGNSNRRANIVAGFEDEATAEGRLVNARDVVEDLDDPTSTVSRGGQVDEDFVKLYLSDSDRAEYESLWLQAESGGVDEAQLAQLESLRNRAITSATREAMRDGDHVLRIVDPETGLYQVVHSPDDILEQDLANDVLAILPKADADKIQYVRANVYGGLVDLRVSRESLPFGFDVRSELSYTEGRLARYFEYLNDDSWDAVKDALNQLGLEPGGPDSDFYILDTILRQAQTDPELADALRLRLMVSSLPDSAMREWFETSGVLISNQKIRQLANRERVASAKSASEQSEYDRKYMDFVARLDDPEYWQQIPEATWIPSTSVFHGGTKVQDDILSESPPMTEQNVIENLHGSGFYTTADNRIAGEYLIGRGMEKDGEPVFYIVDMPSGARDRFLDLDAPMQPMPNWSPDDLQRIDQDVQAMVRDALVKLDGDDSAFDDAWFEIDQLANDMYDNQVNPLNPGSSARTTPLNVGDYRKALEDYLVSRTEGPSELAVRYEAQMLIADALKDQGALGFRHNGGQIMGDRDHDVFIWLSAPSIARLDSVSDEAVRIYRMNQNLKRLRENARSLSDQYVSHRRATPWDGRSLNAAYMSAKNKAILAEYMKQNGIGRILIDDSFSPSGYQVLTSPDMISVSTDQVDAVLPSGLIGKDFVDNTLPVLERNALVRNPATLQTGNMSDAELMEMFRGRGGIVNILRGKSKGTPVERAQLARQLELDGYTHVQIGAADSNMFTNVSELVGSRSSGAAYGAMLGQDAVAQRRNLILANDEVFAKLETDIGEIDRMYLDAEEVYQKSLDEAKAAADALTKRLGKRGTGAPLKAPLGSGEETFTGRFTSFTVDGPFNANNQGSLNASLASSGNTMMANLYGFTDYAMMQLRKSQETVRFTPGSKYYFETAAEQINRYWRNDLIGMAIIRGESDEQIFQKLFGTKQGRAYIRDVEEFRSFKKFIDADRLTEDAREDMAQLIVARRESFNRLVPDDELRKHLIDNEVTPLYLQSQLGWRADLPDIVGSQLVGSDISLIRRMTGAAMNVLGTIPENALVRHPFYRARWRDEMQRQADLYASQGIIEFSEAQLNAMNQVAKKWALKQTNETLYTIQRLSTPAHIFKFVMPFFPAWASSMRFWLLRMPVEQPQNVARYAMLWNAPESAGWVYDDEGNKVQSQDNVIGKIGDKLFGGAEGSILIRVENPALREKYAALTGGNTDIRIPKGSLDMMLQGETFWFPGLTPFAAIPASWLAAQMPNIATAVETGKLREIPILKSIISEDVETFISENNLTRPIYRAVVPFGRPTQEKDLIDVATGYLAPAFLDKWATAIRGMDSAEFASAAKEIHRTNMTNWELGGKEGAEPDFMDAVESARTFYWFRGGMNLTMPFATQFQTRYQFYIDEGRRIDRETFAAGGTYDEANKEFLRLYGPTFFKYTQSLSAGGSGMSATVGEFKEFERNPELMAELAQLGPDASFITMATRPFAEAMNENGFDGAVYSWQMNRNIEGALGKYLRGGQSTELPTTRADRELGWMYFDQNMEVLNALAAERGTTVDTDPSLLAMKQGIVQKIAVEYPQWYTDYRDIGGSRYILSNTALQAMVDSDYFETHKDLPYAQAMMAFYEGRKVFVQMLQQRKADGGSASLDAKSNESVRLVYLNWIERLRMSDPSGNFGSTWERFFQSDPLLPIPALEAAND